jgi:hypothetical protein
MNADDVIEVIDNDPGEASELVLAMVRELLEMSAYELGDPAAESSSDLRKEAGLEVRDLIAGHFRSSGIDPDQGSVLPALFLARALGGVAWPEVGGHYIRVAQDRYRSEVAAGRERSDQP